MRKNKSKNRKLSAENFMKFLDKIEMQVYTILIKGVRRQAAAPVQFLDLKKTADFAEGRFFSYCLICVCQV